MVGEAAEALRAVALRPGCFAALVDKPLARASGRPKPGRTYPDILGETKVLSMRKRARKA